MGLLWGILTSQLECYLLGRDLTHLQTQAAQKLVLGVSLVSIVRLLLVDDGLGVFVDDLNQFN